MKAIIPVLIIISSFVFGQRGDFFREDITFRLNEGCLDVDGYYWFANSSRVPVNNEIYYPFAADYGKSIDSIRLYNISAGYLPGWKMEDSGGIYFNLNIPPGDTVLLQIGYRQKLSGRRAQYILQTTQGWGKPIDIADYKLVTPDTLNIKYFSYPPDKSYVIEKKRIYSWEKRRFMPGKDMIFEY
ncbi:MAG: hypothetical protein ACM3Q2_03995 [Syntrophothermus sp.]